MRLIKTIIFFTLLAYSVLFCIENFQHIPVTVPFVMEIESIPLFMVIILCLIAGILIGTTINTAKGIKRLFSGNDIRNENKTLKKKLDIFETEKQIQDNLRIEE